MKHAIFTSKADAQKLQSDDDKAAGLPRGGTYLDDTPAPAGQGVTSHKYDVRERTDGKAWAYPVDDDRVVGRATKADSLGDEWVEKQVEPKKDKA